MVRMVQSLLSLVTLQLWLSSAQCGPDASKPYPPGQTTCPQGPGATGGGGSGAPASSSSHAAPMLGDVATTTASGTDVRTGKFFSAGENIYGPFEAGFTSAQELGEL